MSNATLIHSGHEAAAAAASHADRETPDWAEQAAAIFMEFALKNGGEFQTEDVRAYAATKGFAEPPDTRAWGVCGYIPAPGGQNRVHHQPPDPQQNQQRPSRRSLESDRGPRA